jgi:hypothetical protein
MKWLGSLLVLCSLCVFSIGCGGGSTEPAPDDEGIGASEDGGEDAGTEDAGTEDAGTEDAGTEDATTTE